MTESPTTIQINLEALQHKPEYHIANLKGYRIKIFSRFNKGHEVSQGRNALRPYRKIICTEPL